MLIFKDKLFQPALCQVDPLTCIPVLRGIIVMDTLTVGGSHAVPAGGKYMDLKGNSCFRKRFPVPHGACHGYTAVFRSMPKEGGRGAFPGNKAVQTLTVQLFRCGSICTQKVFIGAAMVIFHMGRSHRITQNRCAQRLRLYEFRDLRAVAYGLSHSMAWQALMMLIR